MNYTNTTTYTCAMMEINGSRVRVVYRATHWDAKLKPRLYVTDDGRIWLGYGAAERFSHVGNVGDRGTHGTSRKAVTQAANM